MQVLVQLLRRLCGFVSPLQTQIFSQLQELAAAVFQLSDDLGQQAYSLERIAITASITASLD